jgi:gentisate 1,2-dioxygenase
MSVSLLFEKDTHVFPDWYEVEAKKSDIFCFHFIPIRENMSILLREKFGMTHKRSY